MIPASGNVLLAGGDDGYQIQRSLRFRASASAYLNRTPAGAGNRKTWTWSGWIKRGTLGVRQGFFSCQNGAGNASLQFGFLDNDCFQMGNGNAYVFQSSAVYRDPSSWYHCVVSVDTTLISNRGKIYINGSEITAWATNIFDSTFAQNSDTAINQALIHYLGQIGSNLSYLDGYLADVYFIDGQALTPSSFGETNALTGVWQPKAYTGTYGTNGFYLDFEDTSSVSALGNDKSGNGNTWTVNNISLTAGVTYDSMTDVPTLTNATTANYAVFNPLAVTAGGIALITEGNLKVVTGAVGGNGYGTIAIPSSGKYYWEVTAGSGNSPYIGISAYLSSQTYSWQNTNSVFYSGSNGQKSVDTVATSYGSTYTTNDVIGVAVDVGASTITFYKNNVSQGAISHTFVDVFPCLTDGASGTADTFYANFGQRPFAYTPPTGFVALNTFNLPTATILKGNTVMDATLYTGNGSTQTITNAGGFQPDLVWAKSRSSASWWHILVDSVRGVGRTLSTNVTNAEIGSGTDCIPALNSNGFNVNVSPNASVNENGTTYVAWQWQAGQGTTSSNTSGTITSTVSVNATAGFSVVTYTGTGANATVGHGLGVAPKMIIIKARNAASQNWIVYQASMDATPQNYVMGLNLTVAKSLDSTMLNNTAPTSSVFSIGTNTSVNNNTTTYVAYCWSEIDGFSKFGSYTGNGSADGPMIYTGFKPRFVMIKRSDSTSNWYIFDTARNTYNVMTNELLANSSNAEANENRWIDCLSNGFKIRNDAASQINANGATMIYAAFAENPFKNSLAR